MSYSQTEGVLEETIPITKATRRIKYLEIYLKYLHNLYEASLNVPKGHKKTFKNGKE